MQLVARPRRSGLKSEIHTVSPNPNYVFDADVLDMMYLNPWFSTPIKFSTGTSTSSNSMYVEPLALTPEFSILRRVTPFASSGMMSREIPFRPGPPVLTAAVT